LTENPGIDNTLKNTGTRPNATNKQVIIEAIPNSRSKFGSGMRHDKPHPILFEVQSKRKAELKFLDPCFIISNNKDMLSKHQNVQEISRTRILRYN